MKSVLNVPWKDWWWSWNSNTLATWIWRTDSLEKTLMLGKIEGRGRRGRQRIRWLDGITDWMDVNLSKFWELAIDGRPGVLQSMGLQRVRHHWVAELNRNYREGTQPYLSTENWIKDLLSMALPIWTRPNFPFSLSLPSGSFHRPLILLHQRADTLKP